VADTSEVGVALLHGLAEHGLVPGQNVVLESRGANGQIGRELQRLADEFVAARVDVLITMGYPPAAAAKLTGLPVVCTGVGDPVATGLIKSLAHPNGNVTGISDSAEELTVKRLGLLKELAPGLRRIAMLWNADDLGMTLRYRASADAAERLGVTVQALGVREPNDFDEAFASMRALMPDGILMVSDALTLLNRQRVAEFAALHRIPAIYERAFIVREGGLISFSGDLNETYERIAGLVERILAGTKAGDLPFEQPTRYWTAINLRTAHAMGLDVSRSLLASADEIIE
jgi:putative ABC transport system substrate-binding protein